MRGAKRGCGGGLFRHRGLRLREENVCACALVPNKPVLNRASNPGKKPPQAMILLPSGYRLSGPPARPLHASSSAFYFGCPTVCATYGQVTYSQGHLVRVILSGGVQRAGACPCNQAEGLR